ncbi:phenylpyruvate tautomerase MIF-related protein [Pontiella sp.]|uniref:phenylpyruvate tautomerase MIF-related protein n=1 Tax=Pontiella sp. TaxID=2837462 RepID=UPI003567DAEB
MPLINLKSTLEIPGPLLEEISTMIAETIGKPEKYVMVVSSRAEMLMSGAPGAAVHAEVKSLGGLNRVVNHEITMKLCVLLNDHLGISPRRIYVTFESLERDHWGWNGSTFD